jgi:hypothetical protein
MKKINQPRNNTECATQFREAVDMIRRSGVWSVPMYMARNSKRAGNGHAWGTAHMSYQVYDVAFIDDKTPENQKLPGECTIFMATARSYRASMIELVFNFDVDKYELWVNADIATVTTAKHMGHYARAFDYFDEEKLGMKVYEMPMGSYELRNFTSRRSFHFIDDMGVMVNVVEHEVEQSAAPRKHTNTLLYKINAAEKQLLHVRRLVTENLRPIGEEGEDYWEDYLDVNRKKLLDRIEHNLFVYEKAKNSDDPKKTINMFTELDA